MKYLVLFPRSHNIHLVKDVGMIAYKLFKLYGVEAYLATYNNDNYSYTENEVRGLNIDYIKKVFNSEILDSSFFLMKKAKKIDVLQLFHMTISSVIYTFMYKLFNSKGKVFLKLDCTEALVDKILNLGKFHKLIFTYFLNKVDVIGVEQRDILKRLQSILGVNAYKLEYVPNGINYESLQVFDEKNSKNKEDIILNVSRIGSPEKSTDVLLEAFASIKGIKESKWKLVLIGPIEEEFKKYIHGFFQRHPKLKDKIEFVGPIYDREKLYNEYKKSKIFCLSSKFESFGIALLEAAAFGNVIVSTDVGIASELVENKYGAIVSVDDKAALGKALEKFMNCKDMSFISNKMMETCYESFNWDVIVKRLYNKIH